MAESKLFYKYEDKSTLTPINASPQNKAEFLDELGAVLVLDLIDTEKDENIITKINNCEVIPWEPAQYYGSELVKELKQREETTQSVVIEELTKYDFLNAGRVYKTIGRIFTADKVANKLYKLDITKAQASVTLPQSNALPRICRQMQTWWSLENIPPFYGVIIARALYSYYRAFGKEQDERNITARKINYIIKGKEKKQAATFSTIEEVINELAIAGELPIYKTEHGIYDKRHGTKNNTWQPTFGRYYIKYIADNWTILANYIDDTNYKTFIETTKIQAEKSKQIDEQAEEYATKKTEEAFINFMTACNFIKLDYDLLFFSADLCGTVKQTCIYYYFTLRITETRKSAQDIVKVNLQTLYELLQIEDTSANNKSKVVHFIIDELMPKWKAQGIVLEYTPIAKARKYTDIEITLA